MKRTFDDLIWYKVIWPRPFDLQIIQELLSHLAGAHINSPIIWEVRSSGHKVIHLVGVEKFYANKLKGIFSSHGQVHFISNNFERTAVSSARRLQISHPSLSLNNNYALAVTRACLAVLAQANESEEIVLQIILGPSFSPAIVPTQLQNPHTTWLESILGNITPASHESRKSLIEKSSFHGFSCTIRLGAKSNIADAQIRNLLSALRILESAGVKIYAVPEKAIAVNEARAPWHFPLRLSAKELSNFLLLPFGEESLPGVMGLHPKLLLPPDWLKYSANKSTDYRFASSQGDNDDSDKKHLSLLPRDSLEHAIILGPTGSGKSNVMLSLIMANINAGQSILVVDPKADLVTDILSRIPEEREDEVVVIDPSDSCPVGVNPFSLIKNQNQDLVADAILAVFKEIFADSWGIRTQDILSSALLTLAKTEGMSLVLLPALLTNVQFRQKILKNIDDKIGLEPFWASYEAMSKAERNQAIAPVLNKMRQFLLRPGLRNILGQSNPKFSLSDLFTKRRIVLVPLNKGIIGAESARLLGSLIVGMTWTLALNRAKEPPHRRHIINIFIDELQDYLSLPTDLSDALAQARGLGIGLVLAHQYRNQLSPSIRASIDANARNKIVFGLNSGDARDIADMAPELEPVDFMLLPRYHIYTSLISGGKSTGWISGQTLPPSASFRSAVEIKAKSMERYGQDANQTKADYFEALGYQTDSEKPQEKSDGIEKDNKGKEDIGRKKRQ